MPGGASRPAEPAFLTAIQDAVAWVDLVALAISTLALLFAIAFAMRRGWIQGPRRLLGGLSLLEEMAWRWRFERAATRARELGGVGYLEVEPPAQRATPAASPDATPAASPDDAGRPVPAANGPAELAMPRPR